MLVRRPGLEPMRMTSGEVIELPGSIVFDHVANRLHTIEAVLVATHGSD